MARAIARGTGERELADLALRENALWLMREDGLRKLRDGTTTLEEVVRVTRTTDGRRAAPAAAGEE